MGYIELTTIKKIPVRAAIFVVHKRDIVIDLNIEVNVNNFKLLRIFFKMMARFQSFFP